ncbi:MAG: SGNH/GDSL hydrolase family protein [Anaerolineae bacterium]|nr:MAG: SGNH/GDSL hydrolase family protein [Anaerolineae bacterium]
MSEDETTLRYLALGDSYTIGESVEIAERWPEQLAARLEPNAGTLEVEIIARTGWTTAELNAGIDARKPEGPYDLVSLLIGVNNQYRGYALEEYRVEFAALVNRAIEFAGGDTRRVIVLSIPDWGVTPFAGGRDAGKISAEIDAFNAAAREVSEGLGVAFIDITDISREAAARPELLAEDGLHPSGAMYGLWVEHVYPAACAALELDCGD